jgi:hypothetical protein
MNLEAVAIVADELAKRGIYAPSDVTLTATLKTVNFYDRVMWQAVRDLYNGEISTPEFESIMIDLVQNQLRRAWNEGMRSLGLDPETDMLLIWEFALQDIMLQELTYVDPLAADVLAAAAAGLPVAPFHSRVDIWTNRYNDVVNQAAQICAKAGQRMKWEIGATEEHCRICAALNGIVAFESEWEELGVYPQRPPNPALAKENGGCGGWRCDCSIVPTDSAEHRMPTVRS